MKLIAELEKENAELKEKIKRQSNNYKHDVDMLIEDKKYRIKVCKELAHQANAIQDNLTKAKDLIENIIRVTWNSGWSYSLDWKVKAEQFLNSEVEE